MRPGTFVQQWLGRTSGLHASCSVVAQGCGSTGHGAGHAVSAALRCLWRRDAGDGDKPPVPCALALDRGITCVAAAVEAILTNPELLLTRTKSHIQRLRSPGLLGCRELAQRFMQPDHGICVELTVVQKLLAGSFDCVPSDFTPRHSGESGNCSLPVRYF